MVICALDKNASLPKLCYYLRNIIGYKEDIMVSAQK